MSTTALAETRAANAAGGYNDPAAGQFTTPDPLDALTGSRYGYAVQRPRQRVRPEWFVRIPRKWGVPTVGTHPFWIDLGSPGAEGVANVIGDQFGIWPGVISGIDMTNRV